MLAGGHHALAQVVPLQTADVGDAQRGAEVGIFTEGFVHPAPPGVKGDVQDRGQGVQQTGPAHLPADEVGHLLDQVRAPAGGQARAGGEHHVSAGEEAAEGLGVEEHRDAEPASAHHLALDGADHRGQLRGIVHDELGDVARRVAQHLLGSDRVRAVGIDQRPRHPRGQLVALLRRCHLGQQEIGPAARF